MDREFGDKCGIWRILDLFEREKIKATFFLNGITAEQNVDAVKELVASGHELAAQPYIHEYTVTLTRKASARSSRGRSTHSQRSPASRRAAISRRACARRPIPSISFQTWASPGAATASTRTCPTPSPRNKPIVMMPKDFHPNDYTTYETGSRSPRELYGLLVDQFDYLYDEGATSPKVMSVTMHPSWPARVSRQDLPRFHAHARSHPTSGSRARRHRRLVAQAKHLSAWRSSAIVTIDRKTWMALRFALCDHAAAVSTVTCGLGSCDRLRRNGARIFHLEHVDIRPTRPSS